MDMTLSRHLQFFFDLSKGSQNPVGLDKLVNIVFGEANDCSEISERCADLHEMSMSFRECYEEGFISVHLNIEDGPLSWCTEFESINFLQYLLLFHRRAFLFMVLVPEERAKQFLLDKNVLVRCLAKWRYLNKFGT